MSLSDYHKFLATKRRKETKYGHEINADALCGKLFDFQRYIAEWSIERGRAAIFADCGMGKSAIQLQWADAVVRHTGKPILILAPLAVAEQTRDEGEKFGFEVNVCDDGEKVKPGINITNYERLHRFDSHGWAGVVCDESSILKNFDGHYRKLLTQWAADKQYRLACTATPAPNDYIELLNHSEFLGDLSGKEAIALYFIQDGNTTHKWRLKGHAERPFWEWLSNWGVYVQKPSDLGFSDNGWELPPLRTHQHTTDGNITDGCLFPMEAVTLLERRQARRESLHHRVEMAAELANASTDPWVVWCDLNSESEALAKAIPDAVEVRGSHSLDYKRDALVDFSHGNTRVMVSKPSICGHGMNWQHCSNMAFVGLSDSFEQMYQAIRRCWRFGQTKPVDVHVIASEREGAVVANIERKERQYHHMFRTMRDVQLAKLNGKAAKHALVG